MPTTALKRYPAEFKVGKAVYITDTVERAARMCYITMSENSSGGIDSEFEKFKRKFCMPLEYFELDHRIFNDDVKRSDLVKELRKEGYLNGGNGDGNGNGHDHSGSG
jgi:hypothetical protein